MRNDLYRIIDANVNRASEAIRVLEDFSRFSKDSVTISKNLKNIRHYINNLFSNYIVLISNRESNLDIGKDIENSSKRNSFKDIIHANCKRAEEALRVLSEYGQLLELDSISLKKIEEYRYMTYSIEKELLINERLHRLSSACLYLVSNRNDFKSDIDFLNVIEKSIEGGIDIIQLREKHESEKKILELGKEIRKMTNNTDVLFIINDRVDIALACDADGVHIGQDDFPISELRKITPPGFLIGLSTHSIEQGEKGNKSSADYLGVGPVFQTPTKPDYIPAGLEYVSWAKNNISLPWFAIGGIDESNIDKVISTGASKIAVVRAVMNSKDPTKSVKILKGKLMKATNLPYEQIR